MTRSATDRTAARLVPLLAILLALAAPALAPGTSAQDEEGETSPSCTDADCHGDLASGEGVHPPVAEGMCEMCHEGSAEDHDFRLPDPIANACVNCHDDPREGEGGHVHGPVAKGACVACHDPHRSTEASLLRAAEPDLCWRCHGRPIPREGDRAVANVRKEIDTADTVHPAVEMGCSSCHPAHRSDLPGLFTRSFPAGPYAFGADGAYELCADCHDLATLLGEDSSGTGFRDDRINLHRVHVAREKSRSCVLCHAPHGAGDHLLRSTTPFGQWDLPVGWSAIEGGGACASGCHERREYLRDVPLEEPRDTPGAQEEAQPPSGP